MNIIKNNFSSMKKASETSRPDWFDRDNPPRLDMQERSGTLSAQAIRALEKEHADRFAGVRGRVALGLLYLWHDHWDEAHRIAQADEGEAHHDLLHAILHRREKDFSNAEYWFRSAGRNAAFDVLGGRLAKLTLEDPLRAAIVPYGRWSPAGFSAAVKNALNGDRKNDAPLRAVQAEEIITFFETLDA
ncbi:MAG: hypothetical protein K0Q91_2050 [Fibrobacteria bacterium]|nr:hypothetical protein [Fibrobacteria bacterium]